MSISGYGQFDAIKKDTSIRVIKAAPKMYPGVTEIKPREAIFKVENAQLFRQSTNSYKLVFSWYNLRTNEEEELYLDFNKSDIQELLNILEAALNRSDDCEFKTRKFHVGRLGQRVVFFHNRGYTNILDEAARQLVNFLITISPR
jgi:hypothetical protein